MTELLWVLYSTGYLVVAVIFLLLAKKMFDLLTPYSLNVQLTKKDNPAVGLLLGGFIVGVAIVLCGVFSGSAPEVPTWAGFLAEMGPVILYGVVGMVMLFIAGVINDKVVLRHFSNHKEIVDNQNSAVAVIMAATYIGSGLIVAGGIRSSLDMVSALLSFAIGQFAFVAFGLLYQLLTKYDDEEELSKNKNLAAGIAFAGNLLAYGMILMRGLRIDDAVVETWSLEDRTLNALYYALAGCVLLIAARVVTDRAFLPGGKVSEEIVRDRNLNAGYMEAALALSVGAVLVFCL
ncbi:MAG: DUF350 domain-containing protein [Proteobacteria bacterium]|jgi:uncharacterized membrane protein YjfL (UPF0719 family)|nr:DUF350 domain-containing protein [Pseudomonadota bacterium]